MPIHDWGRVTAGEFHHFPGRWIYAISDALNAGLLPSDCYAMAEQRSGEASIPDVLTLDGVSDRNPGSGDFDPGGGTALLEVEPATSLHGEADVDLWELTRQRVLAVRHATDDRVLAMLEVVSPGNKDRPRSREAFVEKCVGHLRAGIHVVVLDVVPSVVGGRSLGLEVWHAVGSHEPEAPQDRPLVQASLRVEAGMPHLYAEPAAVGEELAPLPMFYRPEWYVTLPLAETYDEAWQRMPRQVKDRIAR